jgi:hypothetical protein
LIIIIEIGVVIWNVNDDSDSAILLCEGCLESNNCIDKEEEEEEGSAVEAIFVGHLIGELFTFCHYSRP